MNIGRQIKKARIENGLTQAQFAEKLGIEPGTVSRWESEKVQPRPSKLKEIAKILHRELEYFTIGSKQQSEENGPDLKQIQNDYRRLMDILNGVQEDLGLDLSKPFQAQINQLQSEVLKNRPLVAAYEGSTPLRQAVALFVLTADESFLSIAESKLRDRILEAFQVLPQDKKKHLSSN